MNKSTIIIIVFVFVLVSVIIGVVLSILQAKDIIDLHIDHPEKDRTVQFKYLLTPGKSTELLDTVNSVYDTFRTNTQLPTKVDLRTIVAVPVYDQGHLGSCVLNSVAYTYQYFFKLKGVDFMPSRMFLIYTKAIFQGVNLSNITAQQLMNVIIDSGTQVLSSFLTNFYYGVCEERLYPYLSNYELYVMYKNTLHIENLKKKFTKFTFFQRNKESIRQQILDLQAKHSLLLPSTKTLEIAKRVKPNQVYHIKPTLSEIQYTLLNHGPIVFGIILSNYLEQALSNDIDNPFPAVSKTNNHQTVQLIKQFINKNQDKLTQIDKKIIEEGISNFKGLNYLGNYNEILSEFAYTNIDRILSKTNSNKYPIDKIDTTKYRYKPNTVFYPSQRINKIKQRFAKYKIQFDKIVDTLQIIGIVTDKKQINKSFKTKTERYLTKITKQHPELKEDIQFVKNFSPVFSGGGHAMSIVGYDNSRQCFIIRNSWGSNWGEQGHFYLDYQYILNQDKIFGKFLMSRLITISI